MLLAAHSPSLVAAEPPATPGLSVGLVWWCLGIVLVLGYFVFLYRHVHGKVAVDSAEESH